MRKTASSEMKEQILLQRNKRANDPEYAQLSRDRCREYARKNPEKTKERNKNYLLKHGHTEEFKEKKRAYAREYHRERRKRDPIFAMTERFRARLREIFRDKGYSKKSRSAATLGCSYEDLFSHIESQFTGGMSWDRFSEIHIDHIIPLSSAITEEDVVRLNHYTNLQPLWAADNLAKSDKLPHELIEL